MIDLPKGTLLTVPKETNVIGYIDYTDYLSNGGVGNVPITKVGDIKFSLNYHDTNNSPYWKNWDLLGSIHQYDELAKFIFSLYQTFPLGSKSREVWEQAYSSGTLPNINQLFFAKSQNIAGEIIEGVPPSVLIYPMVEHTENLLRPYGTTPQEDKKEVYSPIISDKLYATDIPADFVLLAQKPDRFNLKCLPVILRQDGSTIGYPKHITLNVLINTKSYIEGIPSTHKLIIKE